MTTIKEITIPDDDDEWTTDDLLQEMIINLFRKAKSPVILITTRLCYYGAVGNRTPDLLHAEQALSQLSYNPSQVHHHYSGINLFSQ